MCPKRQNSYDRKSVLVDCVQEDLLFVDEDMSGTESIYSIITIEDQHLEHFSSDEENDFIGSFIPKTFVEQRRNQYELEIEGLEDDILEELMNVEEKLCNHKWKNNLGLDSNPCFICNWFPSRKNRTKCLECYLEECIKCVEQKFGIELIKEIKDFSLEHIKIQMLERRIANLEDHQLIINNRLEELEDKNFKLRLENKDKGIVISEPENILVCNFDKKFSSLKVHYKSRNFHNKLFRINRYRMH